MKCSALLITAMSKSNWSNLSKAWRKDFSPTTSSDEANTSRNAITAALERALPLLQDPTSVPFVCRYRTDVISPLTTKQMHQLSHLLQKHTALKSTRNKVLTALTRQEGIIEKGELFQLKFRAETSTSKSELEDLYAPYKPPVKGSLEARIAVEHPHLPSAIDELWTTGGTKMKLTPRDAAVTLLANRIAGHVPVVDSILDYCNKSCRIRVKRASASGTSKTGKKPAKGKGAKKDDPAEKYSAYWDFEYGLNYLKDHQVLAIRRGVDQKMLQQGFDIDAQRAESIMARVLHSTKIRRNGNMAGLYRDATHDAWTRLLRKRITSRLWKTKCNLAEERAIGVFCDNLEKALLAPPASDPLPRAMLVLDPGFQAGIKCAILDSAGMVVVESGGKSKSGSPISSLQTVKFLGSAICIEKGRRELGDLLQWTKREVGSEEDHVCVVIGNGHGFREARELVSEVAAGRDIPIHIEMVSEAGASVWSVTEMAGREFKDESAAAVAAVSIGRRYQNPLHELVKIPPKSLGLGMYQHDLNEKELDEKLRITSTHAVAEVGVDINTCSTEVLEKVPSLTPSLCAKIIKARPISLRKDLLNVMGIGPKTFESCAAFVRIHDGPEPLDATLVHPESYDLARWLLKKLRLKLDNPKSVDAISKYAVNKSLEEIRSDVANEAAARFNCTENRVHTVIEHLLFSITRPDPRLRQGESSKVNNIGSPRGCSTIPLNLSSLHALQKACPMRNIKATIRNVVDFGAFVDFGGENDGLLHRSKTGPVSLQSLLVGQEIGIDILAVSNSEKVSVGLAGLNLSAENPVAKRPGNGGSRRPAEVKKRRRK